MEKPKRAPLPLDAPPQEKYDNLILAFFEEWLINPDDPCGWPLPKDYDLNHLGFRSFLEISFYLHALEKDGLVIIGKEDNDMPTGPDDLQIVTGLLITHQGFKHCHSLRESGKNSKRCFVAMRFSDDMKPFYDEAIASAIEENGYLPIRVDREHAPSEQSINDFIIANIKESGFCIADLTHQNQGVYFEMGYALGKGL
ncbi:MAG: hypothetical protein H7246_00850, partial [Phycisphaerae bacterium]|nr:hypothetical protein [Saprospiraceae bacterium]